MNKLIFISVILIMLTSYTYGEILHTQHIIQNVAREEGVYLTKAEIIKDFKRADVDGDNRLEKVYFISNKNRRTDYFVWNHAKIIVTKKTDGRYRIFSKKGMKIEFSHDGMLDIKDIDGDGKDEILLFYYMGAHSGGMYIYKYADGKLDLVKISEKDKRGMTKMYDSGFFTCVPAIYVEDIDRDTNCEVITEDRNYSGDPLRESWIYVYKLQDGAYICVEEYFRKYKSTGFHTIYNFTFGKRKRYL